MPVDREHWNLYQDSAVYEGMAITRSQLATFRNPGEIIGTITNKAAKETGKVVTVEEHSVIGGLGSAVCDVLSEQLPTPVLKIGVNDVFGHSGPAVELIKEFGLDGDSIAAKVKEFVK